MKPMPIVSHVMLATWCLAPTFSVNIDFEKCNHTFPYPDNDTDININSFAHGRERQSTTPFPFF